MAKQENDNDQDYKARATALRLLARREHSRLELSLKLRQRKLPGDIINAVLDDYEKEGWLDDDRFADVYARQRMDLVGMPNPENLLASNSNARDRETKQ